MSLAFAAIRGAYFTAIALAFRQIVSFGTTLYIARLLLPSDFGVFSMVMVVVGLAQVVGDVGISAGLVRTQKNSTAVLSTCFWIALGIGITLAVCVFFLAPVAAWFYGVPAIVPLLRMSALGLVVSFCLPVPLAILQQRLCYREIALSQAVGSFSGAIAAVLLATTKFGIWGLVMQPIVGNLVALLLMARQAKWAPTREYDYATVREILHDGLNLLGAGLSQYARNNLDTVIIGKALQAKDLGVYGLAQTILYAPMYLITSVISRVLFPLIAKVQNDTSKVKETVLTATSRTALMIFPLYVGLFVVADDFVVLTFGDKWLTLAPLIKIMTIPFIVQSISSIASPILVGLGYSWLLFRISVVGVLFDFSILMFTIRYGITTVALGYAVSNSIIGITTIGFVLRSARISVKEYIAAVGMPLVLAALMVLPLLGINMLMMPGSLLRFVTCILAGAVTYGVLIFFFEKAAWQQALNAARAKR